MTLPDAGSERSASDGTTPEDHAEVRLCKHPYPYRASVTVCSDTHTTPVETFEAVHKLVNTHDRIEPGSDAWRRLFDDPEIDAREAWRDGIDGFGLPIADTLWLYNRSIGVFAGFDERTGRPIPHEHNGRDYRDIVDEWLRRGWVDALHTPGIGHIPRQASEAGLAWLNEEPHRRLRVWVNHSAGGTPTCIEPDAPALRPIIRNVVKCGTLALCWIGMGSLARRAVSNPRPAPFPPGQRTLFWLLSLLLVGSGLWFVTGLILPQLRSAPSIMGSGLVLMGTLALLRGLRYQAAQGDNPGSPYYLADLVREFGFRYYWFIGAQPGYRTHVEGTLALPERSCEGGRPSCLRVIDVDDGSRCIVFGRNHKESPAGCRSLELFTDDALEALCERQGTGIIYTHWTIRPAKVFTAKSLDALDRLRRFHDAERIWVAPTSEIVRFAFVRAYLDYAVRCEDGKRVIEIVGVNDPTGEPFVPSVDDLRGISFECPAGVQIEVRLAGESLDEDSVDVVPVGDRVVVRVRLDQPSRTVGAD